MLLRAMPSKRRMKLVEHRLLCIALLLLPGALGHVRLLFPPSRSPYDFTDVTRQSTIGPNAQKASDGAITRGSTDIDRDYCGWKKLPSASATELVAGREIEVCDA
jgi:hypothetical protein